VLAVDTARVSGWAVNACGRYVRSGEVDTLVAPVVFTAVGGALQLAAILDLPSVLVLEKPWGGNSNVVAALGAARERWLAAWRELAGPVGDKGKVVLVQPNTWRCAVLGRSAIGMCREDVRALERQSAEALVGRQLGPDEAPAVLIGEWGCRAAQVGQRLGKRAREKSFEKWMEG
jgi:hypothetical protein